MQNRLRLDSQVGAKVANGPESAVDHSKRTFLRAAGMLIAGLMLSPAPADGTPRALAGSGHKVVVAIIGVRRGEIFSPEGLENIPHLSRDLLDWRTNRGPHEQDALRWLAAASECMKRIP